MSVCVLPKTCSETISDRHCKSRDLHHLPMSLLMSLLICALVVQVEKLLIAPTGVAYASSSEGTDLPLSTNGSYVGKPISEYIS